MRQENPEIWTAISPLAARQLGHITRIQLVRLGATQAWIDSQLRRGHLIRVHAGVYAVGHVPRHAYARAMAAVLACGDGDNHGAALSHAAAGALWRVAEWPATLEVTALTERRRPGIWTHRAVDLEARTHQGIRVTTPVRTVIDLQSRCTDASLVRLVNDLRLAGHLRAAALTELAERSRRLHRLLGDDPSETRPTRSLLEDLFVIFTGRHHLPMPEINAILPENGREVDALYRRVRLIVEVDSWRFHSDRTAFERDRAKDAAALALGYRTLRITDRRIRQGGAQEAATIQRILDI